MPANPKILLRATNLCKSFGGQKVLSDVSVEIREGEVVILRGDNGSGKTTLLNILTGCLEPDSGVVEYSTKEPGETFRFPRRWWEEVNPFDHFLPERVAREGICRTWQDARLFKSQDLTANVAVASSGQRGENPLEAVFGFGAAQSAEQRNMEAANSLLAGLGLGSTGAEAGDRVSFGHAKLAALARSASTGAKVLFLDEPFAGLDEAGVKKALSVLSGFVREAGLTLVIVEHAFNIRLLLGLATKVWTLVQGELSTEKAGPNLLVKAIGEDLHALLDFVEAGSWNVRDIPLYGGAVLRKAFRADRPVGAPVLEVRDLVVFRGNRLIVGRVLDDRRTEGLTFDVCEGELAFLRAPNGWGKTTLLESLAGVLGAHQGSIRLRGQNVESLPPWERAQQGLSLLQSRDSIFASLTVREALRLGGCEEVPAGVAPLASKAMGALSGGERRRVALARLKALPGSFDLLDEPFEGLDESAHRDFLSLLRPSVGRGILIALPSAAAPAEGH